MGRSPHPWGVAKVGHYRGPAERRQIHGAPATSFRQPNLDHVVVLNRTHLHRLVQSYLDYYHGSRTHLGLGKEAPEPRRVQPPEEGKIVALPEVGGLHHRYERRAA